MPRKSTKKTLKPVRPQLGDGVEILNAGSVLEDPITRTLETNYMPYAMSVIVSRALPEIDGFNRRTASCCTPCTRWACSRAHAPSLPTSWAAPCT